MNTAGGRGRLTRLLHEALGAMERGDEAAWRERIDALAEAQEHDMVQRLGRLARELVQSLEALPPSPAGVGLDDACARLDHVVEMTEQATHRTLDLIDEGRARLQQLQDGGLAPGQEVHVASLRTCLKEMALAQSHQDLGGQTIRRVAAIVRNVHASLGEMGLPPPVQAGTPASVSGHGPSVSGLDRGMVDQDDADDLLSRLGL